MCICSIVCCGLLKSVCIFAQLYIAICSIMYFYLLKSVLMFAQKYLVIYMLFCFDKIYLGLNFFYGLYIYGMLKVLQYV